MKDGIEDHFEWLDSQELKIEEFNSSGEYWKALAERTARSENAVIAELKVQMDLMEDIHAHPWKYLLLHYFPSMWKFFK